MFSEPHATKQIEDCVGWGLETDAETLIAAAVSGIEPDRARALCATLTCPVLVIHGDADAIVPHRVGVEAARLTGAPLVTFAGSGHGPQARDPVRFNLTLRAFVTDESSQPAMWTRAPSRRRRALYISSPIGLGHARRDLAIADRLRELVPDLEIDWLAQQPVSAVLEQRGERIHPASAELASESDHFQAEAIEHRLHCFQALRRMDEILLTNFMVFHDVAQAEAYDVWIADEAWDVDYYLHENPELKSAAYVWLTDFVGSLPMPSGGDREAFLTADANADMIEQLARYPRIRDRSIFIGEPDDIVPDHFGPGLPSIREWTREHFDFAGYVTGPDQTEAADREASRQELGYAPDERICVVTVGGSGVGSALLRRAIDSFEPATQLVPGLRMVVVAGPRIDLATLAAPDGVELHAYVHDLPRHLAACDVAITQGGLSTTMELTASRTPFLSFPLQDHFEQCFHVDHRLRRHHAGRRMEFDASPPAVVAAAIAEEIGRPVGYLPVARDGASRAAAMIAALL